jgi:acyl-CoA thioesterase
MLRKLKSLFEKKDRFAKLLGFKIVDIQDGYAKVEADVQDKYLNGADVLHGGFLFSLADYAFAIASNSKNNLSLAINANIMFHKAISSGKIYAIAQEIKDGKNVASYEVKIYNEEESILATFVGTVFRKGIKLINE